MGLFDFLKKEQAAETLNLNQEDKFIFEEVVKLMQLYQRTPKGEGFLADSLAADPVRQIGQRLYDKGGHQFMLTAHQLFAASYQVMGAAHNLESVWDGIGAWRG